jgi:hypothetical protein
MKDRMKRGHDDYINILIERFSNLYDRMDTNFEYPKGEIDVRGFKGDRFDIYEVKCNGSKEKAIQQLQRAQRYFRKQVRKLFYYNGELDKLEEI